MMTERMIPGILDAFTAQQAFEAAKKAFEKNPKCGAIRQLEKLLQSMVLHYLLREPVGVAENHDLGLAIVDTLDWLRNMEGEDKKEVVVRLTMLLNQMEDGIIITSAAKEMLILADPRARKLLVAVHDGKAKPFLGLRRNLPKAHLLKKLQDYGLICLSTLRKKRGIANYFPIATTASGARLVAIIRSIKPATHSH
ncbi:MAG: hypothetical protein V1716_02605 [Candidatus Uhrbacteria bacterium]